METQIIEILLKEKRALSALELNNCLKLKTSGEFQKLLEVLYELEKEILIYHTKKDKYMLFENSHLYCGKLVINKKGFGFVIIENDEDIYISYDNLNGAIHNDLVIVDVIEKKGLKKEGKILRIVKRELKQLIGEYRQKSDRAFLWIDDERIKVKVDILKNYSMGAIDGHKVVVDLINDNEEIKNRYLGKVIKIIGHKNDPGVDIMTIAAKYDFYDVFSEEVLQEVEKIKEVVELREIKDRIDLRTKRIFTIDGDDTKDIDDALSIEKLANQNYLLGVHIADVSYYVKENSHIDMEAYNRGTSVYLADRVLPMIPHKLSNGICSLNPNVERLTISCFMEINELGEVINFDIVESVIKSQKQMTYKNVNRILEDGIIPNGYEDYASDLILMRDLSIILRECKKKRGFLDFAIDESKIIVNEEGQAIDVILRNRGIGEKIIEDFMIVANETIASAIYYMELPFIYRVHGKPDEEKITSFLNFLKILGLKTTKFKRYDSVVIQKILDLLQTRKEQQILSKLMLRSMPKATYDKNNIGHFGIASQCYTHFTSPIRRYPDLTVHRLLRTYLFEKKINKETIGTWDTKLNFISEHVTIKEGDSLECEREVDDIGESFKGIISGVMNFGLFVELPNLIEGLIRIEDLKDDYYLYDEISYSLKGIRSNKKYTLGDEIIIVLTSASKETGQIDFVPFYDILNK